jgi:lysophospholipase-3
MEDTRQLVLRAYEAAGNMKVYLVGHSNGPIAAQYFLLHSTADFREKYIGTTLPPNNQCPLRMKYFTSIIGSQLPNVDQLPLHVHHCLSLALPVAPPAYKQVG